MNASAVELIEQLKRDGFVTFNDLFPEELVRRAQSEIQALYEADLREREFGGVEDEHFDGQAGHSIRTAPSHLLTDVYGKSPSFDELMEWFLTNEKSKTVLQALTGGRIRFRGYNIRRMTGAFDSAPRNDCTSLPHEWHRDSDGEICIGILLSDIGKDEAATALVPGSHLFPYCPRRNNLWSEKLYSGWKFFLRFNMFNRILAHQVLKNASGGYGQIGDAYLLMNDVWHGREPNLHGKESMVALVGAFPAEFALPDEVPVPNSDVLNRLPPHVRQAASDRELHPTNQDSIIHWTKKNRLRAGPWTWFFWARWERILVTQLFRLKSFASRVLRGVMRRVVWSFSAFFPTFGKPASETPTLRRRRRLRNASRPTADQEV